MAQQSLKSHPHPQLQEDTRQHRLQIGGRSWNSRTFLLTMILSLVLVFCADPVVGFTNSPVASNNAIGRSSTIPSRLTSTTTELHLLLPSPFPALFSGSIAGAIGVGVAYPLDTIKTRAQVMASEKPSYNKAPQAAAAASAGSAATLVLAPPPPAGSSMMDVAQYILRTEGPAGFFAGVQTSMVGQAIIKAVVFAVNAYMLEYLHASQALDGNTNLQLLTAAATAGFVTSFLAAPVDRIKVLLQAGNNSYEGRDDQALQAVLSTEGWKGLLGRGLLCTMLREIPAYSLYFGVYGALMHDPFLTEQLGAAAPLVFGATAGCACWIPIYPIDVVKTVIQNTEGSVAGTKQQQLSLVQVASKLYQEHGVGVFWDGLAPRLLRQAVNHATTFSLYEILLHEVFSTV
ncbi:unnamed protein product [Cylindrotheca closterium]|uniref:Mitochondrial carrier protein n=1 Tax=Cylindrotheca closterium TaxID=2856 RepID=A0AAD2FK99_9STRA|nr:unnamed protein product [Cylindrotheca closterium]